MIVPVVLNGWAASTRRKKTRTCALVEDVLAETEAPHFPVLGLRGMFLYGRSRRVRKYIQQCERPQNVLLCVGKSLGARNMVERVLNKLGPLRYAGIYLVTVDPNWPESWDMTPNLNRHTLQLTRKVSHAANVYYAAPQGSREQAGALLAVPPGTPAMNIPLTDCDHFSIVQKPEVRKVITDAVSRAQRRLAALSQAPSKTP